MEIVEILKMYCQYNNVRVYKVRMQVLVSLSIIRNTIDAESLWIKMRFDGHSTSRTSVYLALRWLSERGFVVAENYNNKAYYATEELESIQQLIPQKV